MELENLFEKRYSARSFQQKNVEKEKIVRILQKARLAPSAKNLQPWKTYLFTEGENRLKINEAYPRKWFAEAPVVAVFTGLQGENWTRMDGKDYLMCDVTILTDYFVLAATEEGLGTCYIGAFDAAKVKEVLNLENEDPLLMVACGYASEDSVVKKKKRKSLEEIAVWM